MPNSNGCGNMNMTNLSAVRSPTMLKIASGFYMVLLVLALTSSAALAGPPFLTDDPDPVPYHHWEVVVFDSGDRTRQTNSVSGPATEINNGIAPNTQLHLMVTDAYFLQDGTSARGPGDSEMGVKYRLSTEEGGRPEISIYPTIELPTGNASEGLGNGRAWYKLPLWIEKNWGPWTSYGGAAYAINSAPGMEDYWYGGLLVQRTLSPRLSLGGEAFFQAPQVENEALAGVDAGERSSWIWNAGGQYNLTPDFSLLFSGGRSFMGEGNSVFYVALYRTWGPGSP